MKYATHYYISNPLLDKADEIMIKYTEKDPELINFVQKYREDQVIVAQVADFDVDIYDNLEIFSAAFKAHRAFKILVSKDQEWSHLKMADIPFFFIEGASTPAEMWQYADAEVCDMYIVGDLCFNITRVSDYLHKNNINIRVYPNICQGELPDSPNGFFIRPNDMGIYDQYIDIVEFAGPLDKQRVLYEIYRDQDWLGDLNDLILNLNYSVDNRSLLPCFAPCRLDCRKKCLFDECNECEIMFRTANALSEKEIILEK